MLLYSGELNAQLTKDSMTHCRIAQVMKIKYLESAITCGTNGCHGFAITKSTNGT